MAVIEIFTYGGCEEMTTEIGPHWASTMKKV